MTTAHPTLTEYVELRDALRDALEGIAECLPYVPDYFRERWELDEYAAQAQQALAEADRVLGVVKGVAS